MDVPTLERWHPKAKIANVDENEGYAKKQDAAPKLSANAKDLLIARLKKENEALRKEVVDLKASLPEKCGDVNDTHTETIPILPNGYSTKKK